MVRRFSGCPRARRTLVISEFAHNPCYTDSVPKQNVTLTIDSAVLKNARKYALDRDTSVNQIIRDQLAALGPKDDELEAARKGLKEFFHKNSVTIGATSGKKRWTREELHERR